MIMFFYSDLSTEETEWKGEMRKIIKPVVHEAFNFFFQSR